MKTIFNFSAFILILTSFTSCETGRPLTTQPAVNNKTYQVQYLFEQDGCKVYRFYDMGHYVYFTNCANQTSTQLSDSTHKEILTISKNNMGQ